MVYASDLLLDYAYDVAFVVLYAKFWRESASFECWLEAWIVSFLSAWFGEKGNGFVIKR